MKKRWLCLWLTPWLAVATGSGCHPRPSAMDAGAALPTSADAGPPAVTLRLAIEVQQTDGGLLRVPLSPSAVPLLPATQQLDVTANLPLHNYRLRILDEIDRALASDDTPEAVPGGLRYHVKLLAPLRAGHRYTVALDSQTGTTLDDGTGSALNEQRFEFHTDGEREKDPPVKRGPPKRHRRGS